MAVDGDLKVALEELREEAESAALDATKPAAANRWTRRSALLIGAVAIAVVGVMAFGAWRMFTTRPDAGPRPFLARLTSDVGWTDYPAISRDGKMLAYLRPRRRRRYRHLGAPDSGRLGGQADARRGRRHRSVLLRRREPRRVSFEPGRRRRLRRLHARRRRATARQGWISPRFSPDGASIAYGVTEPPGSRIDVAPANGGPPTPLTAGFYLAQAPVWLADRRSLLFWGQRDRGAPPRTTSTGTWLPYLAVPSSERTRAACSCKNDSRVFTAFLFPTRGWTRATA